MWHNSTGFSQSRNFQNLHLKRSKKKQEFNQIFRFTCACCCCISRYRYSQISSRHRFTLVSMTPLNRRVAYLLISINFCQWCDTSATLVTFYKQDLLLIVFFHFFSFGFLIYLKLSKRS